MANSPYKMKNALGSDMVGKSNQVGSGAKPAAGNTAFQSSVPGGNQRPYWQTTSSTATQGMPAPKPFVMPKNQQAISGGSDDFYAEGGAADQGIAGGTTGTVDTSGDTSVEQWYTMPDGSQTQDKAKWAFAWQYNNAPTSGKADDFAGKYGYTGTEAVDYIQQGNVPAGGQTAGGKAGGGYYQNENSGISKDVLVNLLNQLGYTDWEGQQKQGLDALAKQQAVSMYQLAQQQAARGLSGGGGYMGGADQRIAATQDATANYMLDLQKQQAQERNVIAQLQAAIAGQLSEQGQADALLAFQQYVNELEAKFGLQSLYGTWNQAGVKDNMYDTRAEQQWQTWGGGKK